MNCPCSPNCHTDHERKAAKRFLRQNKDQIIAAEAIVKHPHPTAAGTQAAAFLRQVFYAQKLAAPRK